MPVRLASLIYSRTHSGKTSLLGTFARWLWVKQGLKTRLYGADGGGWAPMQDLVDAGIVDAWDLSNHIHPFETVRRAAQGWWPVDKANPKSPLEPLYLDTYTATCDKHQPPRIVEAKQVVQGATCSDCKAPLVFAIKRTPNPKNDLIGFGLVIHEGLTSYSDMFMDDMSDRSAAGEKMGEEVAIRFADGDLRVASSSRGSYGIAQRRVKDSVEEMRHLPTPYVICSALEDRGTDDLRRVPVYGPKLAGHAAADDCPRWFGPTFSLALIAIPGKLPERRLYLSSYFLPGDEVEHVAGTRLPPIALKGIPQYIAYEPDNPTLLGDVIEMIENGHKRAKEMTAALKDKAAVTEATK